MQDIKVDQLFRRGKILELGFRILWMNIIDSRWLQMSSGANLTEYLWDRSGIFE